MSALLRQMMLDAPALLWIGDDASGTTAKDTSGNARNGTYIGSPTLANSNVVPGQPKVWTPGSGKYIERAYEAGLDAGTGDFVVSFWYKGPRVTGGAGGNNFEPVFHRDYGSSGGGIIVYVVEANASSFAPGTVRLWCGGASLQATRDVQDSIPHLIWVQRVSGVVSIYIDKVLDVTATRAGSVNNGSMVTWIGSAATSGNTHSTGSDYALYNPVAFVGFWVGTSLSAARMVAHYEAGIRSGVSY